MGYLLNETSLVSGFSTNNTARNGTRLLWISCSDSAKADPSGVFRSWEIYPHLDLIWRRFCHSARVVAHLVQFGTYRWHYGIPLRVSPLYISRASLKPANILAAKSFITKCSVCDWKLGGGDS
jgi:hypothetical protein